jgi:hypothetical protein
MLLTHSLPSAFFSLHIFIYFFTRNLIVLNIRIWISLDVFFNCLYWDCIYIKQYLFTLWLWFARSCFAQFWNNVPLQMMMIIIIIKSYYMQKN